MKTARMILTATMVLSLNATSYCMQSQDAASAAVADDVITAPRQNSHDGTRDGFFGSWSDTLDKLGTPYGNQIYALGSDEKAPERWSIAGKKITKLDHANKFMNAVTAKGWTLSEEALTPSRNLIEADRQVKIAASKTQFETTNNQVSSIFAALTLRFQNRNDSDAAAKSDLALKVQALQQQISDLKITAKKVSEQNAQDRLAQDCTSAEELQTLAALTASIKKAHNTTYPDFKVTTAPNLKAQATLSAQNLALITQAFNQRQQAHQSAVAPISTSCSDNK